MRAASVRSSQVEMRGSAGALLASRPESSVDLFELPGQLEDVDVWRRGEHRQRGKGCGPGALGIRAGRIGVSVLRMSRVILAGVVVVRRALRIRVAQHDDGAAIDRHEHEARRHERTNAKHCEHAQCHAVMRTTGSQRMPFLCHNPAKMP